MINCHTYEFMVHLNNLLLECDQCKNRNTRGGNFLSHPTNEVDLIFVAQNPGFSWWNKKVKPYDIVPFALDNDDNKYHLFFDVVRKVFIRKFKREPVFYVTNIAKCVTYQNETPSDKMIYTCTLRYLLQELNHFYHYGKTNIISLGVPAAKVMEKLSFDFYPARHPGWLNRQGKKFAVEYTYNLLRGIYKWKGRSATMSSILRQG